jgi:hypothetical protein
VDINPDNSLERRAMNKDHEIIVASESGLTIHSFSDISDAISACFGSRGLILTLNDLSPEFFDLRTGLAGEIFQKFINYNLRLAIVLPDTKAYGERFGELAYEHAKHNAVRFVSSVEEARVWLSA